MRLIKCVTLFVLLGNSLLANAGITYYVSSSSGKDSHDGSSIDRPWASLERVYRATLKPGDTVAFKAGDKFNGQLEIDESGSEGAPIHFTSYGDGDLPIIDGAKGKRGSELAAILIVDQDHIEISRLKISNFRKKRIEGIADVNAYGILVKNTSRRNLRGFEFHHLVVEEVYPIRAKKSFNETSVTGIRFETRPAQWKKRAFNTGDIYIHSNRIRHTARFGIALRHRPSKLDGVTGTESDYDIDVRIMNNHCEDLGGSCVLMNGVWRGLLESNRFIRSGALVEPELSVNRGSGAWFFRSNHIVAQHNSAIGSRGHNDSAGIHVDFANDNILVQYNFSYDNEGYGTEILGKNRNVIWRHNISVGDATRKMNVIRPEGGKSNYPGKTVFVSDFAVPKRVLSQDVYIYNNTYVVTNGSDPFIELNGEDVHLWNNLFVVEEGARLGRKLNLGWQQGPPVDMQGNAFAGNISPNFTRIDSNSITANVQFDGDQQDPQSFALKPRHQLGRGRVIEHPDFPAAGQGIFAHVSAVPQVDYFGNPLESQEGTIGAGHQSAKD